MKNSEKKNTENDSRIKKDQPNVQDKPDEKRVTTITPANDNGKPGPASKSFYEKK